VRITKAKEVLDQYEEGAITWVEAVRWIMAQTTKEDLAEFTQFVKPDGAWPF
jgi:hypothetical protein